MNENLQSRIAGKLRNLPDEYGRQLLDYLEFLESKYNRSRRAPSAVQRLTENIEDRIGSARVSDVAAKGTAQVMEAAGRLMEGLAAASRVVAEELQPPTTAGNGSEPEKDEEEAPADEPEDKGDAGAG